MEPIGGLLVRPVVEYGRGRVKFFPLEHCYAIIVGRPHLATLAANLQRARLAE